MKFKVFIFYVLCLACIYRKSFIKQPFSFEWVLDHYKNIKDLGFEDVFIYRKCLVVKLSDNEPSISTLLCYWIANAWLCEKFKINLEFTRDSDSKGIETFFENYIDVGKYSKNHPKSDITTVDVSEVVFPRYTGYVSENI